MSPEVIKHFRHPSPFANPLCFRCAVKCCTIRTATYCVLHLIPAISFIDSMAPTLGINTTIQRILQFDTVQNLLDAGDFFVVADVPGCYEKSLPFLLLSEEFDLTWSSVRRSHYFLLRRMFGEEYLHMSHARIVVERESVPPLFPGQVTERVSVTVFHRSTSSPATSQATKL